jgi:hypothetical protein
MNDLFADLICFLLGGLCGSSFLFVSLVNEMDKGVRVPWRSRRLFWRFFGDKSFEETAERAEKNRRELYGCLVVAVMADLAGPACRNPYPKSQEAYDGLLVERERRFQFKMNEKTCLSG